MNILKTSLATVITATVLTINAFAQSAGEVPSSPLIPTRNEPAPKLFLGEPIPEALARGAVIVPYRVENLRILPILGLGSGDVSPRAGHLHVTIDTSVKMFKPWSW
jgi:hypothetical protein